MIIGRISIAPVYYRPDWDDPLCQKGYMPRMIPDWSRNVRADIQLSGTREEWINLLHAPGNHHIPCLVQDIELTQQVIDGLSRMGTSQEQIEEVQRIFDECNEPGENCYAHP